MGEIDLRALMADVGPLDDDILAVVETPEGAYAVRFEDIDVLAEWDDARQRLVLSSEIGAPPADRAAAIHAVLLTYTMAWRSTGGVAMALTRPDGEAVQFADLAGTEITARQIAVVAVNLAQRTRIWRAFFAQDADVEEAPAPTDIGLMTMIRA